MQALAAQIIVATLQHCSVDVEVLSEEWQVFGGQLILEGLGGGDDDRAPSRGDHRNQIGQGLAGSGAGLHDQVAPLVDGVLHCHRHVHLTGPMHPAGQCCSDRPEGLDH